MLINSQKLIGLRVETESGQYVGRVQSFDLEIDTQGVRSYYIKPSLLEGGVFSDELKIHHRQVVDITEKKMVVVDNIMKYETKAEKEVLVGNEANVV